MEKPQKNKIAEDIFRNMYVPNYYRNMPLANMTQYEQGLHKQVISIVNQTIDEWEKYHRVDRG